MSQFELVPFVNPKYISSSVYLQNCKYELFNKMPFYEGLLFNKKNKTIRSAIYLDKKIINTPVRKDFVFNKLIPKIKEFENQ